jgi:hypothetical protein
MGQSTAAARGQGCCTLGTCGPRQYGSTGAPGQLLGHISSNTLIAMFFYAAGC